MKLVNKKKEIVQELVQLFSSNSHFYIVNASGLTVENVNDLRMRCFNNSIIYKVVKNTLIRKSLEIANHVADHIKFSESVLKGFSGILFFNGNGNVPPKVLSDFIKSKKLNNLVLKGAFVYDGIFLGHNQLSVLCTLKSREELIADVMLQLGSPLRYVIAALQAPGCKLSSSLEAIVKKK
jgi:large subunit ribosomal protein L10